VTAPPQYSALPGVGNTAGDGWLIYRYRCYVAADHLLFVRRSRYGETYRRVYLDDIQSIYYCESDTARLMSYAFFPGAVTCAALAFVFRSAILAAAPVGAAFIYPSLAAVLLILGVIQRPARSFGGMLDSDCARGVVGAEREPVARGAPVCDRCVGRGANAAGCRQ
jgi:hypothetical protein